MRLYAAASCPHRSTLLPFFLQSYGDPPHLHSFPHDALPICDPSGEADVNARSYEPLAGTPGYARPRLETRPGRPDNARSEEHTSELQSRENLVCRLLLEKKKTTTTYNGPGTSRPSADHRIRH